MIQWCVAMDADQARRILRIYRGAQIAKRGARGYRKAKDMLDSHAGQTNALIDAEGFVNRVREKRVHPEDVRGGMRLAVNSTPRVIRFVANHIRKARGEDA